MQRIELAAFLRSQGGVSGGSASAQALCVLAAKGNTESLRLKSLAGEDLSVGDYDLRTPLHLAASEGHRETVRFLVEEAKVDTKRKDRFGNSPLEDARREGHLNVVAYLKHIDTDVGDVV